MRNSSFLLLALFTNALINLVFIVFRTFNVVDWSWWIVFSPTLFNMFLFLASYATFSFKENKEVAQIEQGTYFYPVRKTA